MGISHQQPVLAVMYTSKGLVTKYNYYIRCMMPKGINFDTQASPFRYRCSIISGVAGGEEGGEGGSVPHNDLQHCFFEKLK
jgi:hypothetical protein